MSLWLSTNARANHAIQRNVENFLGVNIVAVVVLCMHNEKETLNNHTCQGPTYLLGLLGVGSKAD